MQQVPRFNVLGVNIAALSLDKARDMVIAAARTSPSGYVCLSGVHGLSEARRDPALRNTFNRALLAVPDGMPLVWLGRWHGHAHITRVYGPDLLLAVCETGQSHGLKHFFYGGEPGVAAQLSEKLKARFPGLEVVGTETPPFRPPTEDELDSLSETIAKLGVDVIWIGLSTPKQEKLMARLAPRLKRGVLLGVGAAFDFHSGRVRQAPRWIQRSGFEWLFRMCVEPRRLWKRYAINNPLFVLRTFAQLTGLKKYPVE